MSTQLEDGFYLDNVESHSQASSPENSESEFSEALTLAEVAGMYISDSARNYQAVWEIK